MLEEIIKRLTYISSFTGTIIMGAEAKKYYDTWFKNYYNAYEQKCNFQSYFDSIKSTCPGYYLPFFFSKESINGIDISGVTNAGFMAEFILPFNSLA